MDITEWMGGVEEFISCCQLLFSFGVLVRDLLFWSLFELTDYRS